MNKNIAIFGYLIAVNFEVVVIILTLYKAIPWLDNAYPMFFNWSYILIPAGVIIAIKDYYNVIKKIMKY